MTATLRLRALIHRVGSLALVALLFFGAASPAGAAGLLEFSWNWDVYHLDGTRIDGGADTFSSSSGALLKPVSRTRTSGAPGETVLTVTGVGIGDLATRGFGAVAKVGAQVNPWREPQSPNPLNTDVVAELRFSDRVVPFSPFRPIGFDLSFDFGPGLLRGTLETPSALGAVGSAGVSLEFEAKPAFGIAPTVTRVFERALLAGIHHDDSPIIPPGLLTDLPLVNGVPYDWSVTLRVSAGLIPAVFSNLAPPHSVSRSSFGDTYYWGGLEGVFDAQGFPVAGVTLTSDAGFDWVTVAVVPEPESYAMMLAGLGLLGVVARRRKQKTALA